MFSSGTTPSSANVASDGRLPTQSLLSSATHMTLLAHDASVEASPTDVSKKSA